MKRYLLILLFIGINSIIAQTESTLLSSGRSEVELIEQTPATFTNIIQPLNNYNDTLSHKLSNPNWDDSRKARFGFEPGDVILQWYEAPTDLELNSIGFWLNTLEDRRGDSFALEVKVVRSTLTHEKIDSIANINNSELFKYQLGYYNNNEELFPYTAFYEDSGRIGDWVSKNNNDEPFGEIIWQSVTLTGDELKYDQYTWIDTDSTIEFKSGELICLAIKNVTPTSAIRQSMDIMAAYELGVPGIKFYKTGWLMIEPPETDPGYGWFIKPRYTFDIVADVTFMGCLPLIINNYTILETTVSSDPRLVTAEIFDENPTGGDSGAVSAKLNYSVNGSSFSEIEMTQNGNNFSAYMPGFERGSSITYYISAEDVNGNKSESSKVTFEIFDPTEKNAEILLVYNGPKESSVVLDVYLNVSESHYDKWIYGPLTQELLNYYDAVMEICLETPLYDNREVIRNWLESGSDRSYFISGESWLETYNGSGDKTFEPGSFEYDILGIKNSYIDVNNDSMGGEVLPSKLFAIENSTLGHSLYVILNALGSFSLYYEPIYVWGFENNAINAVDLINSEFSDIDVETRGLNGVPVRERKSAVAHNLLGNENKVAFSTFDPLAIISRSISDTLWFGETNAAPQNMFVPWAVRFPHCDGGDVLITEFTNLTTTLSTEPRYITAHVEDNHCYGGTEVAIQSVYIEYNTYDENPDSVLMEKISEGFYGGYLPGMPPGTDVVYRVIAVDEEGNWGTTFDLHYEYYSVFEQSGANTLFIYNGADRAYGSVYSNFVKGVNGDIYNIDHDSWAGGEITADILANYDNIFEFYIKDFTVSSKHYYGDLIKQWIADKPNRNYFIAGDQWLGTTKNSNYAVFEDDEYEKSVLGINAVTKSIHNYFTELYPDSIGIIGNYYYNLSSKNIKKIMYKDFQVKIDGFEAGEDIEIDFRALGKNDTIYNVVGRRILDNGNKVAFMTLGPDQLYPYNLDWDKFSVATIPGLVVDWFGIVSGVKNTLEDELPTSYSLSQNYPNPFNPATMIEYSIPVVDEKFSSTTTTNVKLIIYDILGREVATLVNERQKPGTYKVEFNTNDLANIASSVLIYRLQAGEYSTARKMIVLK